VGEFLADKCHGKGKQVWPETCLRILALTLPCEHLRTDFPEEQMKMLSISTLSLMDLLATIVLRPQ
jgi:hypothetical protein